MHSEMIDQVPDDFSERLAEKLVDFEIAEPEFVAENNFEIYHVAIRLPCESDVWGPSIDTLAFNLNLLGPFWVAPPEHPLYYGRQPRMFKGTHGKAVLLGHPIPVSIRQRFNASIPSEVLYINVLAYEKESTLKVNQTYLWEILKQASYFSNLSEAVRKLIPKPPAPGDQDTGNRGEPSQ